MIEEAIFQMNDIVSNNITLFAGCPHCGNTDGYINIGEGHWFVCHLHKTQWYIGCDIFPDWKEQTEEQQRAIHSNVADYEVIRPIFPRIISPQRMAALLARGKNGNAGGSDGICLQGNEESS